MIIDLTTKVNEELLEPWLEKQENKHIAMGHVGTHLDSYLKSNIPMEYFKRNGILIDVSEFCEKREVNLKDIENYNIQSGDFVLFKTNRINKIYGTKEYFYNHPTLSNEVINELCRKKISFIGIDAAGIRRGEEHRDADVFCEKNNIYVIENLSNLDKISNDNFTIYTMWLDDNISTGLKCRVIYESI